MALAIRKSEGGKAKLLGLLERLADEASCDVGVRSMMRRAIHAPVTLGVIVGGYKPLYRGWATDLSVSGLGLLTEHDVPMGAMLYVNLDAVAGEEMLLPIRVCYIRRLLKHTFRVGGTFEFQTESDGHAQARLFA